MTKEELISRAKLRIRKMSKDALDGDVGQLVEVALADLKRIGVHPSYLDPEDIKCNAALYSRRKKHFIFDGINTVTALSFR